MLLNARRFTGQSLPENSEPQMPVVLWSRLLLQMSWVLSSQLLSQPSPTWFLQSLPLPALLGLDLDGPVPAQPGVCRPHPACGLDALGPTTTSEGSFGVLFLLCSPSSLPCGASTLPQPLLPGVPQF